MPQIEGTKAYPANLRISFSSAFLLNSVMSFIFAMEPLRLLYFGRLQCICLKVASNADSKCSQVFTLFRPLQVARGSRISFKPRRSYNASLALSLAYVAWRRPPLPVVPM